MAVTIDPRPTVFGDRFIVTGSFEATDASIDLSAFFSSIDAVTINVTGPAARPAEAHSINGTTIVLGPAGNAGTFFAIGRRA